MTKANLMTKAGAMACCLLLGSCSTTPPKPTTPALTPGTAVALLQLNNKAKNWLVHVKKENASCEYKIDLPDQAYHPATIDLDHIVFCGGRPGPRALDASVSFAYDQNAGHWVITRFLS
jgi:hypothetical protein